MVYGDMDPREVLIEVIGDIGEAEVRLQRAEAKMVEAELADEPGYRAIMEFLGAAIRNARVARTRPGEGGGRNCRG